MPPLAIHFEEFTDMENKVVMNYMELCQKAYRNYVDQKESKQKMSSRTPNDAWDEHVRDLAIFRQRHGHCRVPRHYAENPKLGRWVMNVRSHFQFFRKGRTSSLITEERMQQLQEFDFDFEPSTKSHSKFYVDRWAHHIQELHQFKQKTGHCRVPQLYPANKKLGGWVLYVRHQYRKHQAGQASTMTEERVKQLQQLGFDFEPRKGRPGRSDTNKVESFHW